jgi:hypothetical protein
MCSTPLGFSSPTNLNFLICPNPKDYVVSRTWPANAERPEIGYLSGTRLRLGQIADRSLLG